MDTASFPNGGLVGDFEFEVEISPPAHIKERSLNSKQQLDASKTEI